MLLTQITAKPKEATLQILVMPLQDLQLALRLEGIYKVIRMPEIFKSGRKALGVAHFEGEEAIVIDLHQKIYDCPNPQVEPYLILVLSSAQRLYSIPAPSLPSLVTIPVSTLKPLPADYRDRDTLGIASHIATVGQGTETRTFFLLDPDRLFD